MISDSTCVRCWESAGAQPGHVPVPSRSYVSTVRMARTRLPPGVEGRSSPGQEGTPETRELTEVRNRYSQREPRVVGDRRVSRWTGCCHVLDNMLHAPAKSRSRERFEMAFGGLGQRGPSSTLPHRLSAGTATTRERAGRPNHRRTPPRPRTGSTAVVVRCVLEPDALRPVATRMTSLAAGGLLAGMLATAAPIRLHSTQERYVWGLVLCTRANNHTVPKLGNRARNNPILDEQDHHHHLRLVIIYHIPSITFSSSASCTTLHDTMPTPNTARTWRCSSCTCVRFSRQPRPPEVEVVA